MGTVEARDSILVFLESVKEETESASERQKEDEEVGDEEEDERLKEEEDYSYEGMEEMQQDEEDEENVLVTDQDSSDLNDVLNQEWVPGQGGRG